MILLGEDGCSLSSELSLHTQTSCQWSPHHTGVAGDSKDLQLWGGASNWPGPWWPCSATHCSFLPGSCFTPVNHWKGSRAFLGDPGPPGGLAKASLEGTTSSELPSYFPVLHLGSRVLSCSDSSYSPCHPTLFCHRPLSHQGLLQVSPIWCLLLDQAHNQHHHLIFCQSSEGFKGGPTYIWSNED